jgi:hypothetical protein
LVALLQNGEMNKRPLKEGGIKMGIICVGGVLEYKSVERLKGEGFSWGK